MWWHSKWHAGIITGRSYPPNCDQDFLGEKTVIDWSYTRKCANKQNGALHTTVQAHGIALLLFISTDVDRGDSAEFVATRKANESYRMKAYLKNRPHTANTQQTESSIQSHSLNCSFSIKKSVILVCLNKTFPYEIQIPLGVSALSLLRREKVGAHPLKTQAVSKFHHGSTQECIQRCCIGMTEIGTISDA